MNVLLMDDHALMVAKGMAINEPTMIPKNSAKGMINPAVSFSLSFTSSGARIIQTVVQKPFIIANRKIWKSLKISLESTGIEG